MDYFRNLSRHDPVTMPNAEAQRFTDDFIKIGDYLLDKDRIHNTEIYNKLIDLGISNKSTPQTNATTAPDIADNSTPQTNATAAPSPYDRICSLVAQWHTLSNMLDANDLLSQNNVRQAISTAIGTIIYRQIIYSHANAELKTAIQTALPLSFPKEVTNKNESTSEEKLTSEKKPMSEEKPTSTKKLSAKKKAADKKKSTAGQILIDPLKSLTNILHNLQNTAEFNDSSLQRLKEWTDAVALRTKTDVLTIDAYLHDASAQYMLDNRPAYPDALHPTNIRDDLGQIQQKQTASHNSVLSSSARPQNVHSKTSGKTTVAPAGATDTLSSDDIKIIVPKYAWGKNTASENAKNSKASTSRSPEKLHRQEAIIPQSDKHTSCCMCFTSRPNSKSVQPSTVVKAQVNNTNKNQAKAPNRLVKPNRQTQKGQQTTLIFGQVNPELV